MTLQSLIVFVVVACCFGYAGWTLLPQLARRAMAKSLLRLPLHASLRLSLERAASASDGCHCGGCDQGSIKRETQPLLVYRRKS
jgi:hypothetical protein